MPASFNWIIRRRLADQAVSDSHADCVSLGHEIDRKTMPLIVVMEDDAATRMLVASVLKKDGYDVLSSENGADGLALVRAHKPDLVISDVQMPVMDGFAMLQALRADPDLLAIPVVLLTSLQERAHMRIGMTSGADDYITKPFRPGELREAAAAQLNRRQMREVAQASVVDAAVNHALDAQKQQLARLYEKKLAAELSDKWPVSDGSDADETFASATVLFRRAELRRTGRKPQFSRIERHRQALLQQRRRHGAFVWCTPHAVCR